MKPNLSKPYPQKVWLLLLQIPTTLIILAFVPTNIEKLFALCALWILTFSRPTTRERLFFIGACLFFSVLNITTLHNGTFAFNHPNIIGLPYYEFFMWGFYLLHTKRLLEGPIPRTNPWLVSVLTLLYCLAFSIILNTNTLLIVSGCLLILTFYFWHEPMDFIYTGYFIMLGVAIEYTGVWSGQWHYFGDPVGGVPLWFITLWGGVGIFLRRLLLPLITKRTSSTTT